MQRRRLLFTIGLVFITATSFVAPVETFAAEDTCECWCESKEGAVSYAQGTDLEIPASDCRTFCAQDYPGYQMAVCATSSNQLPSQNINCFTADECTKQKGEPDKKYQPPECMNGRYYCYPDSSKAAKVTLSTSIGGLQVTGDLGEYISKVYTWLIGTATTIAIVFIMVAGLRWTLGGLSADQVGKAKKLIQNSVTGLVLLLGTYLLLATINPQLLKLQVPRFPMIKQIGLVTAGTSCGYLTGDNGYGGPYPGSPHNRSTFRSEDPKAGKPYKLEDATGTKCGDVAKVVEDWEGESLPDGTTCTYDSCPTPPPVLTSENANQFTKCFINVTGGQCLSCGQIVVGNLFIEPSSSVCAQLSLPEKSKPVTRKVTTRVRNFWPDAGEWQRNVSVPIINQCFWTKAGSMMDGINGPIDALTSSGTCAMLQIDCTKINDCEDYDTVPEVVNAQQTADLEAIRNHGVHNVAYGLAQVNTGDLSLTSICNDDPCEVEVEGKTQCRSNQLEPRVESWTEFVSLQGNDCVTVND
ncbi:MAG: pilin [Patescibacteria group bacterium]